MGSGLSSQPIQYPYQVCSILYSHTSACAEASAEALEEHMDGLMLNHFQWLVVILIYASHRYRCGISPDQSRLKDTLSMFA